MVTTGLRAQRPRAAAGASSPASASASLVAAIAIALLFGAGAGTASAYSPTAPPSLFVDNLRSHRSRGARARTTVGQPSFVPDVPPPGERRLARRFDSSPVNEGEGDGSASLTVLRGGASSTNGDGDGSGGNAVLRFVSSFWACFGVVGILAKSIMRIVPIALEPFSSSAPSPLTNFQLGAYVLTCAWFSYVEGYKGFQLKFSPLVVSRSRTLYNRGGGRRTPFHHVLLGPLYAMGLFHATKKRIITSWSVTLGVATIVALVKRMPYPWRNVVDAGVVVGLTWGTISIVIGYVRALVSGDDYPIDPALPEEK